LTTLQIPLTPRIIPGSETRASQQQEELIIEIAKSTGPEAIPSEELTILGAVTIVPGDLAVSRARSNLPAPSPDQGSQFVSVDLTGLEIPVKKGQVYFFRLRHMGPNGVFINTISQSTFKGGQLFTRGPEVKAWSAPANVDLAFRIFTDEKKATDSSPTATIALLSDGPKGKVMAEALWERINTSAPSGSSGPILPPKMVAIAFESFGRQYVQLTMFNPATVRILVPNYPLNATITPEGGGNSIVVNSRSLGTTSPGTIGLHPSEGIIYTYSLGDAVNALPPGKYVVRLAFPPSISEKSVDTNLVISTKAR